MGKRRRGKIQKYRSRFEQEFALLCDELGVDVEYEPSKFSYTTSHSYTPDFLITSVGDTKFFIETKGYFKGRDRALAIAMRECNPTLDIRFVFQNPENRITAKSSTTYGEWCTKHGFLWYDLDSFAEFTREGEHV